MVLVQRYAISRVCTHFLGNFIKVTTIYWLSAQFTDWSIFNNILITQIKNNCIHVTWTHYNCLHRIFSHWNLCPWLSANHHFHFSCCRVSLTFWKISILKKINSFLLWKTRDRWKYILDYYYKPWPHLPSYCIGLILGYMLSAKTIIPLSKAQTKITTSFMSIFAILVLYGVYPWNLGWKISPEITAFYSATFRTIWTLCCSWAVYNFLIINPTGFVSSCLSWKGLVPWSRLTYMAYLVHPFVIWYTNGSMRERFTATHFNYFHNFLGHYLLTYMIAFFVGVCFESPFMAMSKLIFMSTNSKSKSSVRKQSVSIASNESEIGSSSNESSSTDDGLSSEEKSIGNPVTLKSYSINVGSSRLPKVSSDTFVKEKSSFEVSKKGSSPLEKNDSFIHYVSFDPNDPNHHTTNVIVVNPAWIMMNSLKTLQYNK